MPDVKITIGDREFDVACQEGEEHFLRAAAQMLDTEAQALLSQIRHLTESRMLLMAGLMLADKTAGLDDQLKLAEKRINDLETRLDGARAAAGNGEVPAEVTDTMAEIAARAEAIAMLVEEKAVH
jgi:cell division protein ZapA